MDTRSDPCAQVEMGVPHVFVATCFHVFLNQLQACAPAFKDLIYISSFLHRYNAEVILFVDPDKEVFLVIMPE